MIDVRLRRSPKLIINLPPRHGKTSITAVRFAVWCLLNNPDWEIVVVSYAQEIANKMSRQARALLGHSYVKELWRNTTLSTERSAVAEWQIEVNNETTRGGYKAVGIGGALTSAGANVLLIDDSSKNLEEADSVLQQEKVWDWYTSVALTRLAPEHGIINIQTRWNLNDLTGKILKAEPEKWQVLRYQAIDENNDVLIPSRFPLSFFESIKIPMPPRLWEALYQQNPINRTGNIVKLAHIKRFDIKDIDLDKATTWLQSWDLRFGKSQAKTSSYVVGQVWVKLNDSYYLIDQVRERLGYSDSKQAIIAMSNKWPKAKIRLVEAKANGEAMEDDLSQLGIQLVQPRGDKIQRLERVYGEFVTGRVFIPNDLECVVTELIQFPQSENDDQTDSLSQGISYFMEQSNYTLEVFSINR